MEPAHPMKSGSRQYLCVLKIALRPTPIANRKISECGRNSFIAALNVGPHVNRKSCTAKESSFDEVVTQNVPTKWLAAPQNRQAARRSECPQANNRVVSPIISFSPIPESKPRRENRSIYFACKLLQSRE